jgi:hypothetical protein
MELKSRSLLESDWETLQEWWAKWNWPAVTKEMLPLNGLGGLMIYKEDTPIVAGFLYLTNSSIAWMEWIVSNKDYKEDDRKEALELLILELEKVALSVGKNIIFSVGKNKSLINIHKDLGYTVDENASYEISKKLI